MHFYNCKLTAIIFISYITQQSVLVMLNISYELLWGHSNFMNWVSIINLIITINMVFIQTSPLFF